MARTAYILAAGLGIALIAGCQGTTKIVDESTAVTAPTALYALRPVELLPREQDPERAQLRDQVLVDADLRNADLRGANLSGLNLKGANFSGADLSRANLSKSQLAGAVFSGAELRGANFEDASMEDARLDGWNLELANFDGVTFARSALPKGLFRETRLVGNVFTDVDLSGADFSLSMLIGVSFQDSNLTNASFRGAVMKGVDFPGSTLDDANVSGLRVQTNGLYEGRKDLFVWVVGMADNEIPPTVDQVKDELGGRLSKDHSIRKFRVPPLPPGTFATACADSTDLAELPSGFERPRAC